jgi:hypothetical protein
MFASAFAQAQTTPQPTEAEIAARRGLLEQAQQARTTRDFARALDLAQRAGRIQMTPSLRLFLAEVLSAMGNHAGAVGTADLCIRETDRDTAARNREQILSNCRAIMAASRQRVGYVNVTLGAQTPPQTAVAIDGAALNEALLGVPYVVNAGSVTVTGTFAGSAAFSQTETVAAGSTVNIEVRVTPPAAATASATSANTTSTASAAGTGASTAGTTGTSVTTNSQTTGTGALNAGASTGNGTTSGQALPPIVPPPNRGGVPVGAVAVMGVGALSLGTSLVFFLLRNSALTGCEIANDTVTCNDAEAAARVPTARTYAVVSMATLGVGAAAVVGGGVWLAVGMAARGRASASINRITVMPTVLTVRDASFSLGIAGSF